MLVVRGSGDGVHASGSQTVAAGEVVRLLQFRAIPAGTPVFLDEQTMRPLEPRLLLVSPSRI